MSHNIKRFIALVIARTKEYWRDRSSLFFSFVMPPILIIVMSLVFSESESLFRVGLIESTQQNMPNALQQNYINVVEYEDFAKALRRVKHHQLDMLIVMDAEPRYWINPQSTKARALEDLLQGKQTALSSNFLLRRYEIEGKAIRYVDWVIPGILGMNLMFSGLFGIGFVIVRYRKNGVLKRLKATPVKPIEFIVAQIISRLAIMLSVSIIIFTLANNLLDLLMLGSYWHLFVVALVGSLSLLSIAMIIAARIKSEELANGLLNALTFPMLLLSEAWFSLDGSPAWLQAISQAFPLTHIVGSARDIMIEGATLVDLVMPLATLSVTSIVCLIIASTLFRWN